MAQWCRFEAGETGRVNFFASLSPELYDGFASVTVMGAGFDESMMSSLWRMDGVKFEEHRALSGKLRFAKHPNGKRLTIHYATASNWSKHLRDKGVEIDGQMIGVRNLVVQRAMACRGGEMVVVDVQERNGSDVDESNGHSKFKVRPKILFASLGTASPGGFILRQLP